MRGPELLSVVLLGASIACGSGTDLNQIVNVNPTSEAGAAGGEGGGTTFQDPFAGTPGYKAGMSGDGHHNAGQACGQACCHGGGGNACQGDTGPAFLIGGTVYTDYKGTTPAPGVEVRIVDSAGHAASTYSASDGNFYIRAASNTTGVTFPAIIGARNASASRPMITKLSTASMGSCGQAKCHVPGGGPQTNSGNYYPIHVP
jgi:hypothetical protein